MDLPIDSLYGSAFARSHELGLHKNMFWATLDPATGSDWGTTMSDQLGGTQLGIPSELARGMSTSNDVRALKYDELLRKSFAVRPGDDLSRAVRARRLTELDVMGILMVVSLAIPDDTASSGFRRGHPFLTVVGAPCAAEKGQSVTAPSLWPDVGSRPARLLPGDFERPVGLLYPIAGTMVHDSRAYALSREAWIQHPLTIWSLSPGNLGLVLS